MSYNGDSKADVKRGGTVARPADLVPENEWAIRLEEVRQLMSPPTFTAFVERVCRKPGEFPVPTARTWHSDREPSLTYLKAVADTFGVSAEWLLTGAGKPVQKGVAYDIRPHSEVNPEPPWSKLLSALVERGHMWALEKGAPGHPCVFEFCASYLKSRGEEPTLERVVEVMDQFFFMLREGFSPPVGDRAKLIALLHSALTAAWLQISED